MIFSRHRDLRRSLLKIGGLGILTIPALPVSDVLGISENRLAAGIPKIGLQLFSVRKELKQLLFPVQSRIKKHQKVLRKISWR